MFRITKKLSSYFAALSVFAFVLTGCVTNAKAVSDSGTEQQLVILHTNDHHGAVLGSDGKGGLSSRQTFFKSVKSEYSDVLILDAGDVNTGEAVSNMFNAEPDIKAYNAMGYEAVTFGNHEFDGSLDKLKKQIDSSDFAWLGANVKYGKQYLGKPYIVKNYNGYKVGIFGLTTKRTLVLENVDKAVSITDEIEAAQKTVDLLRNKEKCNIVILLSHCGNVRETQDHVTSLDIAQKVSGIDLIIDGHSHSYFEKPEYVNNVPVVTANESGKYVGKAVITVKNKKITGFEWNPVAITTESYSPDSEISSLLLPYVEEASRSLDNVVLKTSQEFEFGNKLTRYKEMAIGDFVTDSMTGYLRLHGINVDGAVENGGGIRTHLPAGDVTKKDIISVLPFQNYIYVVSMKGADVIKLFDFVASVNQGAGAFAQVSKEIRYTITYDENGKGSVSDLTIGGLPVDSEKVYKIATNDYMAKGGDGYAAFALSTDQLNTSILLSDAVIEYAQSLNGEIKPVTDGRIKIIGGKDFN